MINSEDLSLGSQEKIKESYLCKKEKRVNLSSAATTYLSLSNLQKTLPEFSNDSFGSEIQKLRYASRYVALELMALWVPRYQNNTHNYMRRYIHPPDNTQVFNRLIPKNSGDAKPYYHFDPYIIVNSIKEKRVCNLGSLLYLNILLDGTIKDTNLQIIKSSENIYYFVLNQEEPFFGDFFNNNLTKYDNFFKSIKSLNHLKWWEIILEDEVLFVHQLIDEIYETAFRVYATSDELINLITTELLGNEFNFLSFKNHIIDFKKTSINILYRYLNEEEFPLITNFKKNKGNIIVQNFAYDYITFISIYSLFKKIPNVTKKLFLKNIELEIYYAAYQVNMPWILKDISPDYNEDVNFEDISCLMCSTLLLIKNKWQFLSVFPDCPVWSYVNSVSRYINIFYISHETTKFDSNFLKCLFVFGAINDLNHLCELLLREHPSIALSVFTNNDYMNYNFFKYINYSMLHCIKSIGNDVVLSLVESISRPTNHNIPSRPRSNALGTAEDYQNYKNECRVQRGSMTDEELHKPRLKRSKSVLEELGFLKNPDTTTANSDISAFDKLKL